MGLRIALIAPPWYPVPPRGYGGTELVVALLAEQLRRRGHHVLLIASDDSEVATHGQAPPEWRADLGRRAQALRELTFGARAARILENTSGLDVIHDHCGGGALLAATQLKTAPVVHTVHSDIGEPERSYYESLGDAVAFTAISEAQMGTCPDLPWIGRVHNAIDLESLDVGGPDGREPYLLWMARICPDKGQHLAIEVARRTQRRLILAGKIEPTPEGEEYYRRCVAPAIDGDRVVHFDDAGGPLKARLLAHATALVAPLQWDEPFGLALAEAMASGTPVIAFPRGAARELVVPGVTGILAPDLDSMVTAVEAVDDINPLACAAIARDRFSPQRMTEGYLAAYAQVMATV